MKIILLSTIFFLTLLNSHGGRTNSEGCHTNRKTGEYHCHGAKKKATQQQSSTKQSYGVKSSSDYDCSRKTCTVMISCAEARYKLSVCSHYSLDRDNDGIPCENICN
jgi:hypothetical protein